MDPAIKVHEQDMDICIDLAACFRLASRYGFSDIIWNHISARRRDHDQFFTNPFGLRFDEISSSRLIRCDFAGNVLSGIGFPSKSLITLHPVIYQARADINCIVHSHTLAGMAVSALQDGLVTLVQDAMVFWNRIGYHDFTGVLEDNLEQQSFVNDLSHHKAMILRNHGLLTVGSTVGEAFMRMYFLNRACEVQLAVFSTGRNFILPPTSILEKAAKQIEDYDIGSDEWPALVRLLDAEEPEFRR